MPLIEDAAHASDAQASEAHHASETRWPRGFRPRKWSALALARRQRSTCGSCPWSGTCAAPRSPADPRDSASFGSLRSTRVVPLSRRSPLPCAPRWRRCGPTRHGRSPPLR
eukprot:scaffold245_cov256-Pinguiococcus_pyrenoidosus.AAC.30